MHGMESFGYGFWWILPILMFFLMIFLCLAMMWGMRGCMGMGGRHRRGSSDSAVEILNRRYALGEIDKEEYEEKKKAVTQING